MAAADRYRGRGVALHADVAPGLPDLRVDPDRIGQILGNLLDDALRPTPPGGQVTLRAAAAARGMVLQVDDTGPGIGPKHLPHLFERFYRADAARDRAHGGSGIGLTIAKALAEAHGGTLTAASPPGGGATFTLILPTATGRSDPARPEWSDHD